MWLPKIQKLDDKYKKREYISFERYACVWDAVNLNSWWLRNPRNEAWMFFSLELTTLLFWESYLLHPSCSLYFRVFCNSPVFHACLLLNCWAAETHALLQLHKARSRSREGEQPGARRVWWDPIKMCPTSECQRMRLSSSSQLQLWASADHGK